jgi:hypothetical protein
MEASLKALTVISILILVVAYCPAEDIGLPMLTAKCPVSMTRLVFADSTRDEPFSEDPNDDREVTLTRGEVFRYRDKPSSKSPLKHMLRGAHGRPPSV